MDTNTPKNETTNEQNPKELHMIQFLDSMTIIVDTTVGYKNKLRHAGFDDIQAQEMCIDFPKMLLGKFGA